jgi:hypothetical protein
LIIWRQFNKTNSNLLVQTPVPTITPSSKTTHTLWGQPNKAWEIHQIRNSSSKSHVNP